MDQDEIDRLGRMIRQAATPPMASEPEPVAWRKLITNQNGDLEWDYSEFPMKSVSAIALYTADALLSARESERKAVRDHIDTLSESLQEGLMTDAGLSRMDRAKMKAQLDALDVAREPFSAAIRKGDAT